MDILVGATVYGTDGKLGEVQRLIADARTDTITDLVVKHGTFFGTERVVPMVHVVGVKEDGCVRLDLDERTFQIMDGFTDEPVTGPNPDYVGPPTDDLQGTYRGNLVYDAAVAAGPLLLFAGKPLGYPGGEQVTPDELQPPAIAAGTAVLDVNGEQVGEVGEVGVDAESGGISRLTVQRGLLFKDEGELPLGWVKSLSSEGILLHVPKDEVEAALARS